MTDIVLLQSQRLSDADNGGGQMTDTVVPDNVANNLFSNISREDRTAGRVNLRKGFLKSESADTTTYLGVHSIVSAPPSDPDVSAVLFTTDSWTDVRSDARNFIESYLVQGPALQMWVYGRQTVGQRSILVFQRPDRPLPNIGDVICLDDTSVTPNNVQFVRISSITSAVQSFTDQTGDFNLNVITLGLSTPLEYGFAGAGPQRLSIPASPTLVCVTSPADAAKYYGVTQPSVDIAAGAFSATVNSVYSQLVPATQSESPITLSSPQGATSTIAAGPAFTEVNSTSAGLTTAPFYTTRSIFPGSLSMSRDGASWTYTDDAKGNVIDSSSVIIGTVDYERGYITPTVQSGGHWYNNYISVTYIPAVIIQQSGYSHQQPITVANRGYLYTDVLNPLPSPGTTTVSYRALGQWYTLTDDGSGALVGQDGTGGGVVRFDSGALNVTLGALPDADSNLVTSWGQSSQYDQRTSDTAIQIPAVSLNLSGVPKAGSGTPVTIHWTVGGVTKTAADNGAGVLSGDGTGAVFYGSKLISLRPTALPDPTTGFTVTYTLNPATVQNLTPSKTGSDIDFTLPNAPIAPHSISINYALLTPNDFPSLVQGNPNITRKITDDGAGGLIDSLYGAIAGASVDYTNGAVSFNPDLSSYYLTPVYTTQTSWRFAGGSDGWVSYQGTVISGWTSTIVTATFANGSTVTVSSSAASASTTAQTDSFPGNATVVLDLTPLTQEPVVPGSVCFDFAGDTYFDRAGSLYRAINRANNSAVLAGTLDYTSGIATLTSWIAGGASTLTTHALLCQFGVQPIGFLNARAPGQSIQPSSFYVQANRVSDSTVVTGRADANGDIATSSITGHIDVNTGFFSLAFGQSVLDSSLTTEQKAQPWYNSANVDSTGHIWQPNEALAGTVKFSCTVESYLSPDPTILGIDPVRLPPDGRVQTIRPGDTLVFRNPLTYVLPNPATAGATYTMPRTGLEDIVLYDSEGAAVDPSQYTTNPSAGTVTMASSLSLGGYTQPLIATHTQADMALCTDVQINGTISWNSALVNAYPAASSYVSSALVAGDLQAEYTNLFSQETWGNTWSDTVEGGSPTAAYNDVSYPIEVLNRDAITMRWALVFTSSAGGNIASETLGIVGTFTTTANVTPINPATGNPWFVLDWQGFGGGWSIANAIRFDTVGCGIPIWFARTTLAGAAASVDDKFGFQARWDE